MKIKSIIFIALAVILVVVGFFSTNTSKETDIISKAVYVSDAKVLPENEGKVVIVPGKVETTEPFIDTLTGVVIPHIKATRYVDIYEEVPKTDENGKSYYALEWKPTIQSGINEFEEMHSTQLIANCKLGEFEIDSQIINNISASKTLIDISGEEPFAKGYNVRMHNNVCYVSKLDYIPEGGERKVHGMYTDNRFMSYEGMPRISYKIPSEENMEYTIIARQKDGKLVYDKDLGMQAAFSGNQTQSQLAETVKSGGMIGAVVAWVIAAFFVLLAVLSFKKK